MTIDTSKMADTEMESTIPPWPVSRGPWPVDFGPKEPPPEVDQYRDGFLIPLLAIIFVIVGTAFAVNMIARLL